MTVDGAVSHRDSLFAWDSCCRKEERKEEENDAVVPSMRYAAD